jgi:hypothetical protein
MDRSMASGAHFATHPDLSDAAPTQRTVQRCRGV